MARFSYTGPGNPDANFNTEVSPMLRITRTLVSSLAVFLVAGVMAPAAANASSRVKKDHPDASVVKGQQANISVEVYNRGDAPQDLKMDGQVYTVKPHQSITLKASPGTDVFADTAGNGFQKGERLFQIAPSLNGTTVKFN